jgi:hypothetical protein
MTRRIKTIAAHADWRSTRYYSVILEMTGTATLRDTSAGYKIGDLQ